MATTATGNHTATNEANKTPSISAKSQARPLTPLRSWRRRARDAADVDAQPTGATSPLLSSALHLLSSFSVCARLCQTESIVCFSNAEAK